MYFMQCIVCIYIFLRIKFISRYMKDFWFVFAKYIVSANRDTHVLILMTVNNNVNSHGSIELNRRSLLACACPCWPVLVGLRLLACPCPCWPVLVGLSLPLLACPCPCWHVLALVGLCLPLLACACPCWPVLALFGLCLPLSACACPCSSLCKIHHKFTSCKYWPFTRWSAKSTSQLSITHSATIYDPLLICTIENGTKWHIWLMQHKINDSYDYIQMTWTFARI